MNALLHPLTAILLLTGAPQLSVGEADEEVLKEVAAMAIAQASVEDIAGQLRPALEEGTLILSDLEDVLARSTPDAQVLISRAAQHHLTPENIQRVHQLRHPEDEDGSGFKSTSDFLHYRFFHFESVGLLNLGRPTEAAARLRAIEGLAEKTPLGLARYPYESHLASAYIMLGEYGRALDLVAPVCALKGSAWRQHVFREAYTGAGHEADSLDEYLVRIREEIAVPLPPFTAVNYEGDEVGFDDVRGEVTLLTTWLPGCRDCPSEMSFLQQLLERHGDAGLSVVAIEVTRDRAKAKGYRDQNFGFATFPFLENGAPGEEVVESFLGAQGNGTYLIDKRGRVVLAWSSWGSYREPELERRVLEELSRL